MGSSPSCVLSEEAPPSRLGCEVPRVWTPPLRELTPATSAGYECITFAEDVLGIVLLPWQKWVLVHALELLGDGTYRFRTVVLLVARQNGKSTLMQVLSLWRMFVDGAPLVIGTAQNLDVAEEQWEGAVEIAEGNLEMAAEIAQVSRVNGKKFLKLTGGQRYKVAAASRRGGRGLSGDLILLDELREHQNWEAWGAVTKTTMARAKAQIWAASNAGDIASIVLSFLRTMAHMAIGNPDGLPAAEKPLEAGDGEGEADSLGIFEYSAAPNCSIWDRDAWAQANPSLGYTITERAIAAAAGTDPEAVFRTEVLCQWVEQMARTIAEVDWNACRDDKHRMGQGPTEFALDVSPEARSCAIVESDGTHIEVIKYEPGTAWVVPAVVAHRDRLGTLGVVLDPAGPAGALVTPLEAAGITVTRLSTEQAKAACGQILSSITDHQLRHIGQDELDRAAANATRRDIGDGGWLWSRIKSTVDIAPLVAATWAKWAAGASKPVPTPGFVDLDEFDD